MIGHLASIVLSVLTPEAPLLQAPVPESVDPQYRECVALVKSDLEEGRKRATRWASDGGGPPAQHCLAIAELAAGFPKAAAVRLEELASRSDAGDELIRARILSQAALAWLQADELALAQNAIDTAFAAAPGAGELYLFAAMVSSARGESQATIDAIDAGEKKGFTSVEGYVLRGRAKHALLKHREAADDVVAALSIDPFNLDALVLRGDLQQAGVDIEAYYTDAGKKLKN
jgi:hypothetical protein